MTERFDQDFWDDRYRTAPQLWSGAPNRHLVTVATSLPPGSALDVGCGEGADAVWLAEHGWQVTATDISTVALDRAREAAGGRGTEVAGRIEWAQADLREWRPPRRTYDLVSAQYLQLPPDLRSALWTQLAAVVAPAGTLLLVGHDVSDAHVAEHRAHQPELFFSGADVVRQLADPRWTVVADTVTYRRQADGPELVDVVVRATRQPQ